MIGISVRHDLSLTSAAASDFLLDSLERLPVDNCFMAVFDIDFAEFSRVFSLLLGTEILTEGFLQQQVTGIFFVKQNVSDRCDRPGATKVGWDVLLN